MAKIFRSFRMDEGLITRLSAEAARRRRWPNVLIEQALNDWFTIESLTPKLDDLARERGLSRAESLSKALQLWMEKG